MCLPHFNDFCFVLVAGTALLVRHTDTTRNLFSNFLIDAQAFDWFLTLEAEVKYVWNAPWNLGRILFFGTRYLVFIDEPISLYCKPHLPSRPHRPI